MISQLQLELCPGPFAVAVNTSIAAKHDIAEDVSTLRARVFQFIRSRGETGATCDEVELHLYLRHQTASARLRELELGQCIIKTLRRRPTASGRSARVYTLNPTMP